LKTWGPFYDSVIKLSVPMTAIGWLGFWATNYALQWLVNRKKISQGLQGWLSTFVQ
jgi:hypothetical protein